MGLAALYLSCLCLLDDTIFSVERANLSQDAEDNLNSPTRPPQSHQVWLSASLFQAMVFGII